MDTFLGNIFFFGFNWAPMGWALCNGTLLQIAQNSALYSLLGVTFGGNGSSTFGLPDLRGRVIVGQGTSTTGTTYQIGQYSGSETVTLSSAYMPVHSHEVSFTGSSLTVKASSTNGSSTTPGTRAATLAAGNPGSIYNNAAPDITLNIGGAVAAGNVTLQASGNASPTPVNVRQPYCVLNACIAVEGLYPSRS